MKTIIKHIGIIVLAILAFAGCKRFDPEERMVKTLDMSQCMKPVSLKTEVLYNKVTLDLKVFPDAEKYLFEIYKSALYDDVEPSAEDLVASYSVDPADIPFEFTTLEDVTLFYRIAATNETKGKRQSLWAYGRFKTSVDPSHICLTPEPKVTTEYDRIRFSWQKIPTDKYLLEIYNSSIPSSGEPNPEDLYQNIELTNDDVPYQLKVTPKADSYYFRVKAIDLEGERMDSKWAKGSFISREFEWPSAEDAFDYGLEAGTSRDASMAAELFSALGIESGQGFKSTITVDKITWLAMDGTNTGTYKGDRITYNRRKKYEKLADKTTNVAADMGLRFKITRPGTFRMFFKIAVSSKVWTGYEQRFVGILAIPGEDGSVTATRILDYTPDADHVSKSSADKDNDDYCVIFEVTEDMLYGIDGAATIYLWHEAYDTVANPGLQLDYYAPRWTPSK